MSYGLIDKVIKRHKEANSWLNCDVLNNHKWHKDKEEAAAAVTIPLVLARVNNDSYFHTNAWGR